MPKRTVIAPIQPRGLSREEAAAYCGLSPESFDEWVKRGLVPGPIPGTRRFDRKALDLALDGASGLATIPDSAFDTWRARRAR